MPQKEGTVLEGNVETEDNVEQRYSYVVHGGYAQCPYGTRPSRLVVPECHGTYIHDMPVMTVKDNKVIENVQPFGYCTCMDNPDRLEKVKEIMKQVNEETKLGDTIMDIAGAVGNFLLFGPVMGTIKNVMDSQEDEDDEYADMLMESVTIMCEPLITQLWKDGSKDLLINSIKALNNGCTIKCDKCNAVIEIVDDGQENAVQEQQGVTDFKNWKEGDPMPAPTQRNLQNLEKNIEGMEKEMEHCTDPKRKAQLAKEIAQKKNLCSTLKDNVNILQDISQRKLQCSPCENPKEAVNQLVENGKFDEMLKAGKIVDSEGNPIKDPEKAKQQMENGLKESNDRYEKLQQTEKTVRENYNNKTPCKSVDAEKMNVQVNKAVEAAGSNQTKRNWADNGNKAVNGEVGTTRQPAEVFGKESNQKVVDQYLKENPQYEMTYDQFNGKKVSKESAGDTAYLYYNGEMLSQNQYNEKVKAAAGETCKAMKYDW